MLSDVYHRALDFLRNRRGAYKQTFNGNPASEAVLQDLAKFCRASQSTFNSDPRIAAMLDGRREVFIRIMDHLHLPLDEQFKRYGGVPTEGEQ
jgi:hypothetical protein